MEDLARPEREWPTQDQRTQWPNWCHLIPRFSILFQYHFHLFFLMADILWYHHWFEFLTVCHYRDLGISTSDWLRICPGGVLPYITYMGMCRPTGSWFWSSWFRMGYPFQRRFLEWGIIFRMHESSSFVSSHLKLFKVRLRLKIWFNALKSKLLYSLHLRMEYKKLAHF